MVQKQLTPIELPALPAPASTVGDVYLDSTQGQLAYHDGTQMRHFPSWPQTISIVATLPANHRAITLDDLELASGGVLELGAGSIFEIDSSPGELPGAAGSEAATDVISAGAATTFTDFFTVSFTPKGTKALVTAHCSATVTTGTATVRLANSANAQTALMVGTFGPGFIWTSNAALLLTGLTPNVAVVVKLQYKCASSGNFYVRAASFPDLESAGIVVQGVLG